MNLEEEIWFRFDFKNDEFDKISIKGMEIGLPNNISIPDNLISTLHFIIDYSNKVDTTEEELSNLVPFLIKRLDEGDEIRYEKTQSEEIPSLRKIVYDHVKKTLEENKEANLDDITDKIISNKTYRKKYKKESIRASVSSILSALRNTYKDRGIESWNESVWRGKSTGRNPHIKVPSDFEMPSYGKLWERYNEYLKSKKT